MRGILETNVFSTCRILKNRLINQEHLLDVTMYKNNFVHPVQPSNDVMGLRTHATACHII